MSSFSPASRSFWGEEVADGWDSYRLNIFGFPNAGGLDDEEQNLGLMDQRFA